MKTIGLIGGLSWESTASYYRLINEAVKQRLGGFHSARLVLYSVDFHDIEQLQVADKWDEAGVVLADAARALQSAGADALLICANTMHKVVPAIESAVDIPILHIADATAAAVKHAGIRTVGLLGTRYTMEQPFYTDRLEQAHGLKVLTPSQSERDQVHRVIFEELCQGRINPESREAYRRIIAGLLDQGAEGVILGCTEISMLIGPQDAPVSLFDTTALHAEQAVAWALA